MSSIKQITGNVGLYHAARELSLAGWNVMPTVRNAKGADLYASSQDEGTIWPIQIKTHSGKPEDTLLGLRPERLVTPWWIVIAYARSSEITCYVLSLEEIRERMARDPGTRSQKPEHERLFWFNRKYYTPGSDLEMAEARNTWHRLGNPGSPTD